MEIGHWTYKLAHTSNTHIYTQNNMWVEYIYICYKLGGYTYINQTIGLKDLKLVGCEGLGMYGNVSTPNPRFCYLTACCICVV